MPFKTSDDTSPAWGRAADTVSYGRVELGKNGSRPSFGFVGTTKTEFVGTTKTEFVGTTETEFVGTTETEFVGTTETERDTTSGAAGWATGAAATGNTITNPAESHAATVLLLELTHQFI